MIVSLQGGLGNQLFGYAFGRSWPRLHGGELFFDKTSFDTDPLRKYQLNAYGLDPQFAYPAAPYYHEPDMTFHPEVWDLPRETSFKGYWQNEKYFSADLMRKKFQIPRGLPNQKCRELSERIIVIPNSCFVGVRRADYLTPERIDYHGVMPLRYYIEAARRMPHDAKYFVFTDDIPWCRENFRDDWEIVDVNNKDEKAWDIWLMSLCTHAIIANSTFHWWGCYLGADKFKGTIVAPKLWFANGLKTEIVPARWHTI